jgi:hypothetical protein
MAENWKPGDIVERGLVTVKIGHAGPQLFIGDVLVRTWLGCRHDPQAVELADQINREIRSAAVLD